MPTDPSQLERGARPLARYRFEYEQRRSRNIVLLCAAFAAVLIGSLVGVNALAPAPEQPDLLAQGPAAPAAPRAMQALAPVPLEPPVTLPPIDLPAPMEVAAQSSLAARPAPSPPPVRSPAANAPRLASAAAPAPVEVATAPPPTPIVRTPEPPQPPPEIRLAEAAASPAPVSVPIPVRPAPNPCAGLRNPVDQLVCSDPDLTAADRRLAAAYRRVEQLAVNPARLQRDQARWRERRDALGPNRAAVLAHYERRYHELWPPAPRDPLANFGSPRG